MSYFSTTPMDTDILESLFRNPSTGKWTIPILTFNTKYTNPFLTERDLLNNDPFYQKRIIDHFYLKLTEKWLYKDVTFRQLLKYFRVEKNKENGTVQLIENIDDVNKEPIDEFNRKYIYKYIEKFFITKNFVEKTIKKFVKTTKVKWYDLMNNTDTLKDFIAYKLKKLIIETIYELQDRKLKRQTA